MESKVQYQTEPTPAPDPFLPSEQLDPALHYVIDRWYGIGEGNQAAVIINGHVQSMTCEWTLKRGEYSQETVRGYCQWTFGAPGDLPFKCDIIVRKPEAEIIDADGDIGIVRRVFQQLARELDLAVTDVAVQHMQTLYLDIPDKDAPNKRVDAKKEAPKEEVL